MAEAEKPLDLNRPIAELVEQYPELPGLLAEMGLENLDSTKSIAQTAEDLGVELSVIAMALQMSGFDVQGYVPSDDGYQSPLGDVLSVLFDNSYHGEPLPTTSGSGPMVSHMEMAIRRAQEEGRLPKDESD
jgi:hypothetical protein